uniref:uncharacterized protein n=1 Tax=Pristiophorus japonicus TaxID=55135 RepID=UPI00398F014F
MATIAGQKLSSVKQDTEVVKSLVQTEALTSDKATFVTIDRSLLFSQIQLPSIPAASVHFKKTHVGPQISTMSSPDSNIIRNTSSSNTTNPLCNHLMLHRTLDISTRPHCCPADQLYQLQRRNGRTDAHMDLRHCMCHSPRVVKRRRPSSPRRRNTWREEDAPCIPLSGGPAAPMGIPTEEVPAPSGMQLVTARCTLVPSQTPRRPGQRLEQRPTLDDRVERLARLCEESVAIQREQLQAFAGSTQEFSWVSARQAEVTQQMILELREISASNHAMRHAFLAVHGAAPRAPVTTSTGTQAGEEDAPPPDSEGDPPVSSSPPKPPNRRSSQHVPHHGRKSCHRPLHAGFAAVPGDQNGWVR